MSYKSKLEEMVKTTPTAFWNDECSTANLQYAIEHGGVGATTNPPIIGNVLAADMAKYKPQIQQLFKENPYATEDEILLLMTEKMVSDGAKQFEPIYKASNKKEGYISIQVNGKNYLNAEEITKQAVRFSKLADNIMVKMPTTQAGVKAMEECTFQGVNINATVSFSVPQAIAVAEAVKRGMDRRTAEGKDNSALHPVCTIMMGRLEGWLQEAADREDIIVDPQALVMSGVAVFKSCYRIYKERGYHTRLLGAAFRHHHHWSEVIGGDISLTIPPLWIKRFNNSDVKIENRIDIPVEQKYIDQLKKHFPDFVKAYEPDGMAVSDFQNYGAAVDTFDLFMTGHERAVGITRKVMLGL